MSDNDFFAAFDAYCEENHITEEEAPMAFGAFLHLQTGWDGEVSVATVARAPGIASFFADVYQDLKRIMRQLVRRGGAR